MKLRNILAAALIAASCSASAENIFFIGTARESGNRYSIDLDSAEFTSDGYVIVNVFNYSKAGRKPMVGAVSERDCRFRNGELLLYFPGAQAPQHFAMELPGTSVADMIAQNLCTLAKGLRDQQ